LPRIVLDFGGKKYCLVLPTSNRYSLSPPPLPFYMLTILPPIDGTKRKYIKGVTSPMLNRFTLVRK
jgi:hypothetical protein